MAQITKDTGIIEAVQKYPQIICLLYTSDAADE